MIVGTSSTGPCCSRSALTTPPLVEFVASLRRAISPLREQYVNNLIAENRARRFPTVSARDRAAFAPDVPAGRRRPSPALLPHAIGAGRGGRRQQCGRARDGRRNRASPVAVRHRK